MSNRLDTEQLLADCQNLQQSFSSLLLSTVNEQGEPLASFAPYVEYQGCFYIFVSDLAQHTKNMLLKPIASVMFIESEKSAKNLFARQRAVIQVAVEHITKPAALLEELLLLMEEEHGNTVKLLKSLSDFKMLELKPTKGRYVVGFGKAYDWDIKGNKLTHISEQVLKDK